MGPSFRYIVSVYVNLTQQIMQYCLKIKKINLFFYKIAIMLVYYKEFQLLLKCRSWLKRRTTSSSLGSVTALGMPQGFFLILDIEIHWKVLQFSFLNLATVSLFCYKMVGRFDRQERFIKRWIASLSDPRVTHEIRAVWVSYWSKVCICLYSFPLFLIIVAAIML